MAKMLDSLKKCFYKSLYLMGFKKYETKYLKYKKRLQPVNVLTAKELKYIENRIDILHSDIKNIKDLLILQALSPQFIDGVKEKSLCDDSFIQQCDQQYGSFLDKDHFTKLNLAESFYVEQINFILHILHKNPTFEGCKFCEDSLLNLLKKCETRQEIIYRKPLDEILKFQSINPQLVAKFFALIADKFGEEHNPPQIYLASIAYFLYINEQDKAISMLESYIKFAGLKGIEDYSSVAHLAMSLGHKNDEIEKSVEIFHNTKADSEYEKELTDYFKDNTVAVVGNGPIEDQKTGELIDSYDIVVRFNCSKTVDEFKSTHGTKTNIRFFGWSARHVDGNQYLDFAVNRRNPYLLPKSFFSFYEDREKTKFLYLSDEIFQNIYEHFNLSHPTTGFLGLCFIKKYCPNFTRNDCFGFSFLNDDLVGKDRESEPFAYKHYFDNVIQKGLSNHTLEQEIIILNELFPKNIS